MIEVENLTYSYPKKADATIRDISFRAGKGEIFGFLGPSGAGKSTTQKILNGLLKNYMGKVMVNGQDVSRIKNNFYEEIGVAFEFPNLYLQLTALENLNFFASLYMKKTVNPVKLLESVNLLGDKDTKVSAFSKGMKMRLNFVKSILNQPKILFLDEPTSGLDPMNGRKVKDIIWELKNQGTTIFLTTHNMSDADELCDQLAFMVEGKIPVINNPQTLKLMYGKKTIMVETREKDKPEYYEFPLKDVGKNKDFLEILNKKEIATIHTQEASLEDIFIRVTGKKLTEK